MSNDTIMLFGSKQEQSRPAKEIIKSSIGFEKVSLIHEYMPRYFLVLQR